MGELFRFGSMQLAQPGAADHFSESFFHLRRGESHRKVLELFMIEGQDDEIQAGELRTREVDEIWVGKSFGQLDLTLTAAAAEDDRVAVTHPTNRSPLLIHQDERVEGVIRLALAIQGFDPFGQGGCTTWTWLIFHGASLKLLHREPDLQVPPGEDIQKPGEFMDDGIRAVLIC